MEIRGDRPTYWPSRLRLAHGQALVEPLDWRGSADQRCLRDANCLAIFQSGGRTYAAGELLEIIEI
jgi:molybdopterin biosynthesis enzyme